VKWLTRLDELGWEYGVGPDAFRHTNTREFRAIAAKLNAREPRVARAQTAFELAHQRDLIPEGIAYDPVDDVFYVSGIYRRKVLRVDRSGKAADFIAEGQDGMLGGLGLKVDAQRRLLWVISSTTPEMRGWKEGDDRSMLAVYDLRDGHLVRKIETAGGMLNDLTLLEDGSVFATDMGRHNVMRLAPEATTLEIWAKDFSYPNGIAVSEDERFLYVADFRGITRFDLRDQSRTRVESKSMLGGIDGLSVHRGELIGIQNTTGRARVIRIDPAGGDVEILESGNPLFEIPTTGTVAGDHYYFIANPGLRAFHDDHTIWPMEKLEDPIMLRIAIQ
jgi:sugar lactone lactonase YvrE